MVFLENVNLELERVYNHDTRIESRASVYGHVQTYRFLRLLDPGFDLVLVLERLILSRIDLVFAEDLLAGAAR